MKRTFSAHLSFSEGIADGVGAFYNGLDSYVAQEDILVESVTLIGKIGSYLTTLAVAGREYGSMDVEVSGAAEANKPGIMAQLTCTIDLTIQGGITPNVVNTNNSKSIDFVFQSPYLVKEEGSIAIHAYIANELGQTVTYTGKAIIRYTKA